MDACTKGSLIPHFAPFKEVPQSSSGSLQDSRRHTIADRIEFNPPLSPHLPPGGVYSQNHRRIGDVFHKRGEDDGEKGGGGGGGSKPGAESDRRLT